MKNKILLFATLFAIGFGAQATTINTTYTSTSINYFNDYGDSFTFVERGVTFAVFQNGEFDFYINPRNGVHVGYQGNGIDISFNSGYNYDAYVQYDNYGAIIQVEDIYIDYDYYGRVNRIGNTNIQYNRDRLVRVGGLRVYYDNRGYYSHYSGYINSYNRHYVFHPYHNYFVRPFFEYSVVSYKPYRNHYKPTRYTYNRDHSRNTYYGNNNYNKRSSNNTRQRVATQNIPKRNDKHLDRNSSRNLNSKGRTTDNRNSNSGNNSERRINNNVKSSDNRQTSGARTNGNSRTVTERSTTITKRTPERTVQQKRTVTERQPTRVQNRKSNDSSRKSDTVQKRTKSTEKRESSKSENTRKRRSS